MQETPQEYQQRVIGYTEGHDPVKLQAKTVKQLENLLNGVPSPKLRKRRHPINGRSQRSWHIWLTRKLLEDFASD